MKPHELIEVCDQLEYMAKVWRESTIGLHPDAEVPGDSSHIIAEFIWGCRPEAVQK